LKTYNEIDSIADLRNHFSQHFYEEIKEKRNIKNNKNYKKLTDFLTKNFKFDTITINDLLSFTDNLYSKLKAPTRNRIRSAFRKYFKFLYNEKQVTDIYAQVTDKDQFGSETIHDDFVRRYPSLKEYEDLTNACENLKELCVIYFTFGTGIRATGIAFARIEDILWDEFIIKIYGAKRRDPKHESRYGFGKKTKDILKKFIKENRNDAKEGFLFINEQTNKKYTRFGIRLIVKRVGERIGIPNLTTHSGKWFKLNMSDKLGEFTLKELQLIGQHSDAKTTMRYLHARMNDVVDKTKDISVF
jgi:integrase